VLTVTVVRGQEFHASVISCHLELISFQVLAQIAQCCVAVWRLIMITWDYRDGWIS